MNANSIQAYAAAKTTSKSSGTYPNPPESRNTNSSRPKVPPRIARAFQKRLIETSARSSILDPRSSFAQSFQEPDHGQDQGEDEQGDEDSRGADDQKGRQDGSQQSGPLLHLAAVQLRNVVKGLCQ